jgi:glycosyltransferase involved in cell wall biosynthesis
MPKLASSKKKGISSKKPNIWVDVTTLWNDPKGSGVHRAVRNIMFQWSEDDGSGFAIAPIVFDKNLQAPHRIEIKWLESAYSKSEEHTEHEPVSCQPGDIFIGLDLHLHIAKFQNWFLEAKSKGAEIVFLVYDLIPLLPGFFSEVFANDFLKWLRFVRFHSDKIIAISQSTKNELVDYFRNSPISLNQDSPKISWFQLGFDGVTSNSNIKASHDEIFPNLKSEFPIFLMVGTLEPHKAHAQVLEAFEALWEKGFSWQLVWVGKSEWHLKSWIEKIKNHPHRNIKWFWSGNITDEELDQLYLMSDALIAASWKEGFGLPLVEAAQRNLPLIARDIPVFREVAGDGAFYFKASKPEELAIALQDWMALRARDQSPCPSQIQSIPWENSATQLMDLVLEKKGNHGFETTYPSNNEFAIHFYSIPMLLRHPLQSTCLWFRQPRKALHFALQNKHVFWTGREKINSHKKPQLKRILVDVTWFSSQHMGNGVQRVVKNILRQLLINPPNGWEIRPIAFTKLPNAPVYVDTWAENMFGFDVNTDLASKDANVFTRPGDIFLGLDLPLKMIKNEPWLLMQKRYGMQIVFVGYDLLPFIKGLFTDEFVALFTKWWQFMSLNSDKIIAISKTVCNEMHQRVLSESPNRVNPLRFSWFKLGVDEKVFNKEKQISASKVFPELNQEFPIFLMVSTIEPRKGYPQVLAAFERLWEQGIDAQLVIVGKTGWLMDDWIAQIKNHPLKNIKWFWSERVTDEELDQLYRTSTALISASVDEGFGLPLIEAGQYGLPVILRDIEIYREVVGDHGFYFNGFEPEDLADAILVWLDRYKNDDVPSSRGIDVITWKESASQLICGILESEDNHGFKRIFYPNPIHATKLACIEFEFCTSLRHLYSDPKATLRLWRRHPVRVLKLAIKKPRAFFCGYGFDWL